MAAKQQGAGDDQSDGYASRLGDRLRVENARALS
jgi:hypothetical protein